MGLRLIGRAKLAGYERDDRSRAWRVHGGGPGQVNRPLASGTAWRGRLGLVKLGLVSVGLLVVLTGCGLIGSQAQPTNSSAVPKSSAAKICATALGGTVLTSSPTTVGTIRATNLGGPAPGLKPGADAFPGVSAATPAAWCWVRGPVAKNYICYAAIPSGRYKQFFAYTNESTTPTGPPPATVP